MLPWKRPLPHADFATDASTLLADLRVDVARRGAPHRDDFKNPGLWTASWGRGKQAKGLHKAALAGSEQWLFKCAWCEEVRPILRELDVDHYRPKARVTEWGGTPPIISDTPPPEINPGPGYWWLAFEWENYSLACKTCNEGWKRSLFPVVAPRSGCVEGVEATETPLLLDPGSSFRTRDHFRWNLNGVVEPESLEGYATIVTCGLNRTPLMIRRGKVAIKTVNVLDQFVRTEVEIVVGKLRRALRWQCLGRERRNSRAWFAGSSRSVSGTRGTNSMVCPSERQRLRPDSTRPGCREHSAALSQHATTVKPKSRGTDSPGYLTIHPPGCSRLPLA